MKNATNKPEKEREPQTAAVCIHASTKQCNHMLKVRAKGFLLNLNNGMQEAESIMTESLLMGR